MEDAFDIREVARRTGLTSRALRFYEARGLLSPLRTASGRRFYGPAELARINEILALKKAGLTLAQIARLTARAPLDLAAVVDAQLHVVEARTRELAEARALLLSVKSRIDRGEPVDSATFCSLIRNGDMTMNAEQMKKVADLYFTPGQQAHWHRYMERLPASFDRGEYSRRWSDLWPRIADAVGSDPASPAAQALHDEWQSLLAAFPAVAPADHGPDASAIYDERVGTNTPSSSEVWKFMHAAGAARGKLS